MNIAFPTIFPQNNCYKSMPFLVLSFFSNYATFDQRFSYFNPLSSDENKRILMDLDVVLKSHDCEHIVLCLGCFVTDSDVWICMELMATCFDKLLRQLRQPIPEAICGKVAVSTLKALHYLKVREEGYAHSSNFCL